MRTSGGFPFFLLLLFHSTILLAQSESLIWESSVTEVSPFSSPRACDLNGDGVLDLVIGAGIEDKGTPKGIFAFDGSDGSILWQRYARNQVYGSPLFQDINQDGIKDVFITGRDAQLYALDGTNGNLLWQFWSAQDGSARDSGWYNFYLPQWIPDQNQDGIQDLLLTNGGDATLGPTVKNRPAGYLMALNGLDGSILQLDTMPDRKETYHSPLLVDFFQDGNLQILFGSGGETIGGTYYQISLSDFMAGGLSQVQVLLSDSMEGYIAVPSVADLNHNGIPDLIVPQLNATIIALEGSNGEELWRHEEPGTDMYVSPTIGQFTGDDTPDIFTIASVGNWPFYQQTIKLLIDGATGQLVWSEAGYKYQLTSGIAIDWDEDGYDEILFSNNQDLGDTIRQLVTQFSLYDFNDGTISPFDLQRNGAMIFSVPLVQDLDDNQSLDLLFATHDNTRDWYRPDGFTLHRMELGFFRDQIAWAGYQGTDGNGIYPMNLEVSVEYPLSRISIRAYPNPVQQTLFFHAPENGKIMRIEIFDAQGQLLLSAENQREIYVGHLATGMYFYQVQLADQYAGGRITKR